MKQKTLIILRHGKALPARGAQKDSERGLAERGVSDSERMGEYLAEHRIKLQKIVCSTAERTRQTFAMMQKGYGKTLSVEYLDALYMATDEQLAMMVAGQPEYIDSLMLIGHNPGLHELAMRMAKDGDDKDVRRLAVKFPTCALAVIELKSWNKTQGKLVFFVTPAEISAQG